MKRYLGYSALGFYLFLIPLTTTVASAESMSVTQVITITARVAPARSIVVNDKGQMTKIYSNTDEAVMPKVYLNDVPGQAEPLTPALLAQYNSIISQQKNLDGIAIPVALPAEHDDGVMTVLLKPISSLTRSIPL